MSDLFTRLKSERKRLGLSQSELGQAGGVSKDAQLNYESGARSPSADYLQNVAAAGVDVLFVLTGARQSKSGLPAELEDLARAYDSADAEGRATLHGVAMLAMKAYATQGGNVSSPGGHTVVVGGDIGQHIVGDQTITAPVTFTVGGKRK